MQFYIDTFIARYMEMDSFGEQRDSYVSNFSITSQINIWANNLSLLMLLLQFSLSGIGVGGSFQVSLLMQFLIYCLYSTRVLQIHMKVLAINAYENRIEQASFAGKLNFKSYMVIMIYIIFIREIYFYRTFIFIFLCSIWTP